MATASVSITPECSICCEVFKTPKVITCGHTFCLECIERYIGDKKETFSCPICQQNVQIPEGGAKEFPTNFIVQLPPQTTTQVTGTTSPTTQVSSTTSPTTHVTGTTSPTTQVTGTTSPTTHVTGTTSSTTHVTGTTSPTTQLTDKTSTKVKDLCSCNRERPIDYYCLNCHCVLCHKCFLKDHNGHEYLDVECETVKEKATELVLTSEKFIQNKIKDFEETHVALVEARERLQRFTEDACSRITKQTDTIIEDIKASRERIMTDIKTKSQESESKLIESDEKIMGDLKNFKLNLETNFPSLKKDSDLQILVSLEKMKELEELCKDVKVETPSVVQYLDWVEKDFSFNIDMLGSTVLKQYHIPKLHRSNSYQFYFNINDIKKECVYYSQDKFSYSNLIWSCSVLRCDGYLDIDIKLLPEDNPRFNYCYIDGTISVVNIDNSKTITRTFSNKRVERGYRWLFGYWKAITWSELTDKNKGYLNSNNQFVIQLDITQIRDISSK